MIGGVSMVDGVGVRLKGSLCGGRSWCVIEGVSVWWAELVCD